MRNPNAILIICITVIILFGMHSCVTKVDPKETAAIAEACAKVGKEPHIRIQPGNGITMGCRDAQPATTPSN